MREAKVLANAANPKKDELVADLDED